MKELLLKVKEKCEKDEEITNGEEKIVLEFAGLMQMCWGGDLEDAIDMLIQRLCDNDPYS